MEEAAESKEEDKQCLSNKVNMKKGGKNTAAWKEGRIKSLQNTESKRSLRLYKSGETKEFI